TALITPFREDGALDWSALDAQIDFQLESPVTAIVPGGSIGEFTAMSLDERRNMIARCVSRIDGKLLVVAGTADENPATALELTRDAAKLGVDAVMVKLPHYFGLMPDEAFWFFQALDDVGCPFVVYNNPSTTRHDLSGDTLERVSTLEHFVALKEAAVSTTHFYERLHRFGGRFPVIAGAEDCVFFALLAGAPACMTATAAFSPSFMRAMYEAVQRSDLGRARELHCRLWEFRRLLRRRAGTGHPAYVTYTKAAMEILGLPAGPPRPPLLPLDEPERQVLRRVLVDTMGLGERGSFSDHLLPRERRID
ncbi:MAG: hypothetical protein GEU78_18780, partial [Actinobacteria bacterium]|nr:hypothetical protein [Actinomycetota bacterium]